MDRGLLTNGDLWVKHILLFKIKGLEKKVYGREVEL